MYVAVMLAVPAVEDVKVEAHVAVPVTVPADKVQFGKVPVTPDTAKAPEPMGVVGDAEVSVTVVVQVEDWPRTTTALSQLTEMVVAWAVVAGLTFTIPVPLLGPTVLSKPPLPT